MKREYQHQNVFYLFCSVALTALLIVLISFSANAQTVNPSEYSVFNGCLEFSDSQNALYKYLAGQVFEFTKNRSKNVGAIQTLDGWKNRQKIVAETLKKDIGAFPEKTPLNAKVVKVIKKDGFRIEHIVFESMPNYFVTASIFIPSNLKKKAPAIIYCVGHAEESFRNDRYQEDLLNFVHKGFIAFSFDPIGQGERVQYLSKDGKSTVGGPTIEHSFPGSPLFVSGNSLGKYMIWDGIRSVDYLISRKEVDAKRIGITGISGGGTQTALIAAMDERIYAAAPECFITNFTRLFQTIGPQDAEQVFDRFVADGLDHPDFLEVRAPKPALMITTTNDFFNIQGAMESEEEISKIYQAYGESENFGRIEDYSGHAFTDKNRQAKYAFFQKQLNNPGDPTYTVYPLLTPEEMTITKTGQVYSSLGGKTPFSMNCDFTKKLTQRLEEARTHIAQSLPEILESAQKLSGYEEPEYAKPVYMGNIKRDNYYVEKYFVTVEGGYTFPYLLFKPDMRSNKYVIYLNPKGKSDAEAIKNEIEPLLKEGINVLSPDLVGYGEMGPGSFRGDAFIGGVSHNMWYSAMLIGRSLVGVRAADVVLLSKIIQQINAQAEIIGLAKGEMAPIMLHAAAFSKNIHSVVLASPCSSFASIVLNNQYNSTLFMNTVPSALTRYDLPDLAISLAPRTLFIIGPTDGAGKNVDTKQIEDDMDAIRSGYQTMNASDKLHIVSDFNYSWSKVIDFFN